MKYMFLICTPEDYYARLSEQDMGALFQAYGAFQQDVEAAGVYLAAHRLQPSTTATSVRLRDGETLTTDGPYADTKEQCGGYYLLECKDLDEALAWAARIPSAAYGTIEVRPVMEDM